MEEIRVTASESKESWTLPVLYEDEDLFALSKPSRLLTSPDRYDPGRPNLMRLLHEAVERGAPWARQRGLSYLMNSHRLDFETSGHLLLAKNKPALINLANLFGIQKPLKKYAALVHGTPAQKEFQVDAKLALHPTKPGRTRVDHKSGKLSTTNFVVREIFTGCSLLHCFPLTGRTHQIRVHLTYASHPVIGDALYGGRPLMLSGLKPGYRLKPGRTENPLIDRVALHAESITLPHPRTGEMITIEAPWPKDLTVAVRYLRRYATPYVPPA